MQNEHNIEIEHEAMYVSRNTEVLSCNWFCSGKAMSITYSECVFVCVCSLSYLACNADAPCCRLWPAPLYNIFPHFLINGTIFEKKKLLKTKCVLIFSTNLSEIFLLLRKIQRDIILHLRMSSREVPVILVRFE